MNILISTLGASWAVVPEIYGWLAPGILDLYQLRPDNELIEIRDHYELVAPDEIWLCTTDGERAVESVDCVVQWWRQLNTDIPLRIWQSENSAELDTHEQLESMRELIVRLVLMANEKANSGKLYLSLAGGRKTMSADLQWAGSVLGADAMLHVIAAEPLDPGLIKPTAEMFSSPLPANLATQITPVYLGSCKRSDSMDLSVIEELPITGERFQIPLAESLKPCFVSFTEKALTKQIVQRETDGRRLLGNYVQSLGREEPYGNWRTLYRLPPAQINKLRTTRLAPEHLQLLTKLPKVELHRHIGGCLSFDAQCRVAAAVLEASDPDAIKSARGLLHGLLDSKNAWPDTWPIRLRQLSREDRAICAAILLRQADKRSVLQALYQPPNERIALVNRHPNGFGAYERPGELSGSAVLGNPAAISVYAQEIVTQALNEGLTYLELRGSPGKYDSSDPATWLKQLRNALEAAGARCNCQEASTESSVLLIVGFIWILDRRADTAHLAKEIALGAAATDGLNGFLLGFDLAGDERHTEPSILTESFEPSFRACLSTTIHAGEGQPANHIWQATYHLHADRIGHGLTLADSPELMKRFRDRRICLELCPTSNREVVGFHDPEFPEQSKDLPVYPLRAFIDAGVPVTICTDNPGFSSPNAFSLAEEYIAANRMCASGITIWETLALVRNGFKHAFASGSVRHQLLAHADKQIFELFLNR